jgi:hypothetical protein
MPELEMLLLQLMPRLCDEFGEQTFLALSSQEADLYAPLGPPFGPEVGTKFTGAIYDISEASKCLALGRATATVFHLMRTIERALRAIYSCLSLPTFNNPSWGILLAEIRKERLRRGDVAWPENSFFQDIWQRLDSIKDAQRDPTIHVETIHTEEEAKQIFESTKGFMKKIASRMDENGEPKA